MDPALLLSLANLNGMLASGINVSVSDLHLSCVLAPETLEGVSDLPFSKLSVPAIAMLDLQHLRTALTEGQIASIATARHHRLNFASDCPVFRKFAMTVLPETSVYDGDRYRNLMSTAFGILDASSANLPDGQHIRLE